MLNLTILLALSMIRIEFYDDRLKFVSAHIGSNYLHKFRDGLVRSLKMEATFLVIRV